AYCLKTQPATGETYPKSDLFNKAVPELTYAANQVSNQLLTKPFQVFAIVALSYYIINFSLTWLANRLELRIASRRQRAQSAMGKPVMPLVLDPSPSQTQ
ncbi:hypothetical protein QUE08_27225, partial [Klebsiella pneumoniae]|nr:hypothetical protein [Klebsiella pneumoniae]